MTRNSSAPTSGFALVPIIIMFPFLILLATLTLQLTVSSYQVARTDAMRINAQFAADAGADYALYQINQDASWAGTPGEVILQSDSKLKSTYRVVVTTPDADHIVVTSSGRSYDPASPSVPKSTVTVAVNLRPVRSGQYSIVSGVGGLKLSNSAKVVGGDVLVNGTVTMSNTSQIGLTTNPVNVEVAHQSCPNPPDATYPRLCNPGENGQPISLTNQAHIYGTVKANNQTDGSGMSNPGLTTSSGVAAQALPAYDRTAQKAAVTTTLSASDASCFSGGGKTITWPANLKIVGNVSVGGKCNVIVNGNVWITGTLTLSNQAKLTVAESMGTTRPVIMVDGGGTAVSLTNSTSLASNSQHTGFEIITYWSRASCSPDCTSVTGTDLYNSRNDITIDLNNSSSAPETILYAHWSEVKISNSGAIGALIGQTVELANSGTITFGTSTSTGSTYWVIDGYKRLY